MEDFSKYLGIPYKERGRNFRGLDCWGLVRLFLLSEYGIEVDDYSQYSARDMEEVKRIAEKEKKKWIKVDSPKPGDVVEIQILKRDFHVGIIPFPGYILHICNERFSEMNKLTHPLIKRSIRGIWRHNALFA
jgi:cell wall-associated NlpC family hydrolase